MKAKRVKADAKFVGYIRVSTEDQAEEGVSLAMQEAKIRAYAELYGIDLAEIVCDDGYSAKNINRPGLSRVLDMLRSGTVKGLIVYKLDRLSRYVPDIYAMVDEFFTEKAGMTFRSVCEAQFNTSTPDGRIHMGIIAMLSQWERETISVRTIDALRSKKARGELTGKAPIGLRLRSEARDAEGRFLDQTLIEDPAEVALIAAIREARASGLSIREIAAHVSNLGFRNRRGGPIHRNQVDRILRTA